MKRKLGAPRGRRRLVVLQIVFHFFLAASTASAQSLSYPDPCLDYVFPAGARQGQKLTVEFGGTNGFTGASQILVEGPTGIAVSDVKVNGPGLVTATFEIAADALPGRRTVRVLGGNNPLTNGRSFFVGKLPEVLEVEPKGTEPLQELRLPVVVNGRINPTLDVDEFRFGGKAGQKLVAAVIAHRLDSIVKRTKSPGFLDTSLELLDASGNILAAAEDTLGLDPLVFATLPADGQYSVRLKSLSFQGSPESVYRLTLGEVPYPTAVFPAGGRRGEPVEVEFFGPNVPPGTKQTVSAAPGDTFPFADISLPGDADGIQWLPFAWSDVPEVRETEPNDRAHAAPVTLPLTINARFDAPGDQDWHRLTLKKGEGVLVQTMAQRHLFSPVDTSIEIQDASGKRLTGNDDGRPFNNECLHDFQSADSWQAYRAETDGEHFIRVRDQAGTSGARAVYRLRLEPYLPDFQLLHWPDAVPIWGPGTTASFVVQVLSTAGLSADIELRVEGLPPGWTAPIGHVPAVSFRPYTDTDYGTKALLTITAPADAVPGTMAEFRVVGRAVDNGRTIEHASQPLSLLGNSHNDRMHLRSSRISRAVVGPRLDSHLETTVRELTVEQGATAQIPVKLIRSPESKSQISITPDGPTYAAGCAWQAPFPLKPDQSEVQLPFTVNADRPAGTYSIVISRSWASDLRNGRPGPCTPLITLKVMPPGKK